MPEQQTQTFTVKDVPKEYAQLFNQLVEVRNTRGKKSRAEVFAEMVMVYAEHRYESKEAAEQSLRSLRGMHGRGNDSEFHRLDQ